MSLMDLFDSGNTGNTGKTINKVKNAVIVVCYSPSGLSYEVEASSPERAYFLRRMNPPPANTRNISHKNSEN